MNPLVAIAGSVLPEILKLVFGDKVGGVADAVQHAVTQVTGESDPAAAQKKVEADPKIAADLRAQLASIAADEEEKKRQAQLETLKAQLEDQDKQRQAELEEFKQSLRADIENTASARLGFTTLAQARSPFAWAAPIVSVIVTLGFFTVLALLLLTNVQTASDGKLQVINVIIGTLTTAFATVVSFWMGSSQGSREKDATVARLQDQQAAQAKETIKAQSETVRKAIEQQSGGQTPRTQGATPQSSSPIEKSDQFDRCLDVVLRQEGGFSNDPDDPGGATNWGITIEELKKWRGSDVTIDDVKNLKKDEAREIYRTNYWNLMKCEDLPFGVDLTVFDFGVNAGPSRSVKTLQKIIGVEADGSVGPLTLTAAKATDARDIISTMAARRLDYYRSLPTWEHFGRGWTNRTNSVMSAALKMVDESVTS
jgi:lysozyme family protein